MRRASEGMRQGGRNAGTEHVKVDHWGSVSRGPPWGGIRPHICDSEACGGPSLIDQARS